MEAYMSRQISIQPLPPDIKRTYHWCHRGFLTEQLMRPCPEALFRMADLRFCIGSICRATTTWSALRIRWTLRSSARSRARLMRAFARRLWPWFRSRSLTNRGFAENFAPHATTTATKLLTTDQSNQFEAGYRTHALCSGLWSKLCE